MKKANELLLKILRGAELIIALLLMITIFVSIINVCIASGNSMKIGNFELEQCLGTVLTIVVGVEFVKMLVLHSPQSVVEVLLYAVARQVIMSHDSAINNFIGVAAVGLIFVIRKYLYIHEFEADKKN